MIASRRHNAADGAREASSLLEPVFERLGRLSDAVVASRQRSTRQWSDLSSVRDVILRLLNEDGIAVGSGFVAAPGEVDGQDRFLEWWQRSGRRVERLRLNFDTTSIDVYDYLQMDWYELARAGQSRVAFGPYVDYSGSELYIVTATMPVLIEGRFIGVAGADLSVAELERRLVGALRSTDLDAVIVSSERRVIAANTPRWVVGDRLPAVPGTQTTPDSTDWVDVAEMPLGTGWVLALADPE